MFVYVPSSKPGEYYEVTYYGGFWRCECHDYIRHFKQVESVGDVFGSFTCKHILAAINHLFVTGQYDEVSV